MITVSFSGMATYDNCPSSFQRRYILKEEVDRPDEASDNPKRRRGTMLHNEIDAYLQGHDGSLSTDLLRYQPFLEMLRHSEAVPERQWALNKDWEECSFSSDEAMVRGILDAILVCEEHRTIEVYEWKTGRKYPDHPKQRELYGMAALHLYPDLDAVYVTTLYLDQFETETSILTRNMLPGIQWIWQRTINRCQPPQPYHERPNWKCRFCDYAKENGGKCRGQDR